MAESSTDMLLTELEQLTRQITAADGDVGRLRSRREALWRLLRRRGVTGVTLADVSGVTQPVVAKGTKGWDR